MSGFSLTRYAAAVRRSLLGGLTLNDMLNLKEQHTDFMSKIRHVPVIKRTSDYFALSFLREVNIMDKRFLKKQSHLSDKYPWKKVFNTFLEDLFTCDSPEKRDRIMTYYHSTLPTWIASPPETLNVGKQGQKYIAAFNYLLKDEHVSILLENIQILKKYSTSEYVFQYALQSYIWRYQMNNSQKRYSIDITLSMNPPEETESLLEHILSRKKLHRFFKFPAVSQFHRELQRHHATKHNGKGIYHDLHEMMSGIIQHYFPDMESQGAPVISWGEKFSVRQIGAYRPIGDLITMSPVFDLPKIQREMIKFIIYHELLHKKLGSVNKNGREFSHTTEFRMLESHYKNAEEIDKAITSLFYRPATYLEL